jgi:hypothetical protein
VVDLREENCDTGNRGHDGERAHRNANEPERAWPEPEPPVGHGVDDPGDGADRGQHDYGRARMADVADAPGPERLGQRPVGDRRQAEGRNGRHEQAQP